MKGLPPILSVMTLCSMALTGCVSPHSSAKTDPLRTTYHYSVKAASLRSADNSLDKPLQTFVEQSFANRNLTGFVMGNYLQDGQPIGYQIGVYLKYQDQMPRNYHLVVLKTNLGDIVRPAHAVITKFCSEDDCPYQEAVSFNLPDYNPDGKVGISEIKKIQLSGPSLPLVTLPINSASLAELDSVAADRLETPIGKKK